MPYVLDASAMIAYARKEIGAGIVIELLHDRTCEVFAHAINLCEVFYDVLKTSDEETARSVIDDFVRLNVVARDDMDRSFWEEIAKYKASLRRLSLADCVAIALTRRENASLVTTDHGDFDRVAEQGICRIQFIR